MILSYNGRRVKEAADLPLLVAETTVGHTVAVELSRGDEQETLSVTVGELAEERRAKRAAADRSQWGLVVRDLQPQERLRTGFKTGEGILVSDVLTDSPAARANVRSREVILEANHAPIGSVEDFKRALDKTAAVAPLLLLLKRPSGASRFVSLAAK